MRKLFTILLAAMATSGFAQTLLMDNFNYGSNDSLIGVGYNNGWILVSSTVNPLRATGTGLTFTGYNGSGVGNAVPMANNGQDACKDLKNSQTYTSGSVYASLMVNVSAAQAAGDYFFGLLPSGSTTLFSARTFIKLSSTGYYKVAISRGSIGAAETISYSNDSFALNTTYLFVAKYTFNTVSAVDDSVRLYVLSSGIPATEPTMATCSALGGTTPDLANVARVALRQGSASNAATLVVDGIRVSNSWANGPLPVSFSSFNAKLIDQNAHLTWSTSSETNNSGFEIERSLDGSSFETIGFVKGAGNSNKTISYLFTDANLAHPIAYYRLKQTDFDGKFDYSETITVSSDEAQIEVTPNPFVENISIAASNQDQMVFAEIIDITGKVKASSTGMGNLTLDTKDLNQGVYFVRVNHGEKVIVKRIIKN
jgi:hypothetical protein